MIFIVGWSSVSLIIGSPQHIGASVASSVLVLPHFSHQKLVMIHLLARADDASRLGQGTIRAEAARSSGSCLKIELSWKSRCLAASGPAPSRAKELSDQPLGYQATVSCRGQLDFDWLAASARHSTAKPMPGDAGGQINAEECPEDQQ